MNEECDLDAVLDVELAQKPRDVRLDGRHRDKELAGESVPSPAWTDSTARTIRPAPCA